MLGAGGGIGQPLSLLLKMNRMVTELALYDVANVAGVAADLSHCNTPTQVPFTLLLDGSGWEWEQAKECQAKECPRVETWSVQGGGSVDACRSLTCNQCLN